MSMYQRWGLLAASIGILLIGIWIYRGSMEQRAAPFIRSSISTMSTSSSLVLASSAFAEGAAVPKQYTCDGSRAHPPLTISGAPHGVKSFALIMDDPDVPTAVNPEGRFLHWVVFNIPADTKEVGEDEHVGIYGANQRGVSEYAPPCPPPQYEPSTHRYRFHLYALDSMLALTVGAHEGEVLGAMQGHILAEATLMGTYSRK